MTDEQRAKRIHHHMYETCEGIAEHAERIVALEELVADLYQCSRQVGCDRCGYTHGCSIKGRMSDLGIEVDE